ncbi:MAG TPA: LamG domain-containing protein, partial [Candidatus Binatia bacterium]|nr:LamG domain-containing protein [Candidatus Binatia bacterium]
LGTAPMLQGTPIRDISFGGRSFKVKHGGRSRGGEMAYADYRTVELTTEGQPRILPHAVEFRLRGKEERLDTPVQDRKLFGTGLCGIFNGSTSFVDCGTDSTFNFTSGAFRISFMIFIEAFPGANAIVIGRGLGSVDGWDVVLNTSGRIQLRTNQSGANQVTSSEALTLGRWIQVDISRTGAAVTIYLDGVLSVNSAGTHVNPTTASRNLYFGRNNGGTVFFAGALDDIRIASSASTQAQFEDFLHRPLDSTEYSSYLGYWAFEDGPGAGTIDNAGSVGSAADGTVTSVTIVPSCMGPAELSGTVMRDVWGEVWGYSPLLVDYARQIYLVHSAAIEEIVGVHIGGDDTAMVEDGGGVVTSWLTWITDTTASGEYQVCNATGWTLIRLGSEPEHRLTLQVRGDKSDGTYRNTTGALIRYIATTRGTNPLDDSTEVDDSSFDDFDSAKSQVVGLSYTDELSVAQVISAFAEGLAAVTWFGRSSGRLKIKQIDDPELESSVQDLNRHYVAALNDGASTLTPAERGSPVSGVTVRYNENPTVMGTGDLLTAIDEDWASFYRKQWRTAQFFSPTVKAIYKDAKPITVNSRFIIRGAAGAEAARRKTLLKTPDQGFTFSCRPTETQLDFMDVVTFHYQGLDAYNAEQSLYGTTATSKFYVVGIQEDEQSGGFTLTLWRPRVV